MNRLFSHLHSSSHHALWVGYAFAVTTVLLWAGFVLIARVAGQSGLNPFDVTALRFGVAACVLLPLWIFWKRVKLFNLRMLVLSLLGGLGYALGAYTGLHISPASHGAVLLSGVLPFFMSVMAWYVLGERPSRQRYAALTLIGMGVICTAIYSLNGLRESWPGDLLLMAASAGWALYTVLVKRWGFSPWEVTTGVALLSALIFLPFYVLLLPKSIGTASWTAILWQGFFHGVLVVIVAMLLFMQAMIRLGPTRLGAVMAIVPALAGLGAVIILHEPLSVYLVAGLALTSVGAWLGSRCVS